VGSRAILKDAILFPNQIEATMNLSEARQKLLHLFLSPLLKKGSFSKAKTNALTLNLYFHWHKSWIGKARIHMSGALQGELMKKALAQLLITATAVVSIVACNPNKDSNGGGGSDTTVATTPTQSCNIYGNTSCNPGQFQQFGTQFIAYNGTYNGGYFCGCPAGYRPIMTNEWGLNCAPDLYFPGSSNSYYGFHYSQVSATIQYSIQNGQWTSIQQDLYRPVGQQHSGCHQYAAAACDIRLNQSNGTNPHCGISGGTCQQTSGGSSLGVCSRPTYGNGYGYGYGNNGYGGYTQPGCQRYMGPYGFVQVCGQNAYNNGYNNGGLLPR